MKKFIIQVVLLLLVTGVGIIFFNPITPEKTPDIPFLPSQPTLKKLEINGHTINVEVADTQSKRSKGLGGRESIGEFEGMLFVFDKLGKHAFWMKGLKFPLDFIWIKDQMVVDITENVPPPKENQADSELPIYSPKTEVDKVLEIPGGSIKKINIKLGDMISVK